MHNILWMEYLPAFGHLVTNHQNQDSPPLERMEEFFYHGFNGLDGLFPMRGWKQNKNKINPLERMEEFFYHGFYGLDGSFPMRDCEQDKNPINPLERMRAQSPGAQASALVL